tara:strand:- start:13244 stop:13618 length:375 start_codon:yes stop_codon:yes gene_type:complete
MTPYKILYIEDYEPAAITLDFILKDIGHTPTGALTGAEALELAAENHYDLIMIDVKLPDMPGHVVAEKIRALPGYQSDRTIIIGHSADIDHLDNAHSDVFDFAENKDFEPHAISRNIQRWTQSL